MMVDGGEKNQVDVDATFQKLGLDDAMEVAKDCMRKLCKEHYGPQWPMIEELTMSAFEQGYKLGAVGRDVQLGGMLLQAVTHPKSV